MTDRFRRTLAACFAFIAAGAFAPMIANAAPPLEKGNPKIQKRVEAAMERQDEAVSKAIADLLPQRAGQRDIYFIGIAGWGDQDVFRKEVRAVRSLFERNFDAQGRAVSLVNHAATLDAAPLAIHRNIERAIMGVAEKMDLEEDVLVLFMTSHGIEWGGFSLTLNGQDLGALKGAQLARMLGMSRIRNRVVIVSSCFSGQFVPALAEEHTLLITAAASDRTSFGCTSTAEWTWFGQAFFRDAFPRHKRFAPAFDDAKKRVEAREKKEKFTPSVPQIRVGEHIRQVLDEMGL